MKIETLIQKLEGVRFRVNAEGQLQARGLPAEFRPLVERHRAQLREHYAPTSFELGDRVRTPQFEGVICDREASRHGRWPVRPDHDVFGESVRYFYPDEIERLD